MRLLGICVFNLFTVNVRVLVSTVANGGDSPSTRATFLQLIHNFRALLAQVRTCSIRSSSFSDSRMALVRFKPPGLYLCELSLYSEVVLAAAEQLSLMHWRDRACLASRSVHNDLRIRPLSG